tara:strand:- start:267 stop:494 length:228 start_codon:yes stop_codon:yes gene_type:complete
MLRSSVFILIVAVIVGLSCFVILSLNKDIINLDLLFFETQVSTGILLLISFLTGSLITFILEMLYFYRKKGKPIE